MSQTTDDEQYLRNRAKEARGALKGVRDADTKRVLLTIAENFDELAKRAKEPGPRQC